MALGSGNARAYQPRRARASPLYRLVQDELEEWAIGARRDPARRPEPCAEDSLRSFLTCGIHRFGVVRYRCAKCDESLFVPFSCKRRMACPSCDGKRSALGSARALDELFPQVPYRQWVLVIPKRLRYFVHRDKRLPGELSALLARLLTRFYASKAPAGAAPAQLHAIQRFGSRVNLHVHVHAVVSDGAFAFEGGVLRFHPAPQPTVEELSELNRLIRRKVLLLLKRVGAVPEEAVAELLARPLGGFSLDGSVRVEAEDRAGLGRLVGYILRPAISVKRLSYRREGGVVRYFPKKGHGSFQDVVELEPAEFMARFARLIPPARVHLVRHHGALGPRSPLRAAVTQATAKKADFQELLDGLAIGGVRGAAAGLGKAAKAAAQAVGRAAGRGWAACLARIFEVDVLRCARCGDEMKPVAAVVEDRELDRLLAYLGVETDFPKTQPARSPPLPWGGEESQLDGRQDEWDGRDGPGADG